MRIYFLRHGEADWSNWDRADDERPLTNEGIKETQLVAKNLRDLDLNLGALLSSPLPRAYQTAEIAARLLGILVIQEPVLAPGFNLGSLSQILNKYEDQDLMLVGHESDFSTVLAGLTGGAIKLARSGLARVDIDNPDNLRGELVWLIAPKIYKDS